MQSTSFETSSNQEDFLDDFFVFGYGSLIWNPGFEHSGNPIIGFVCEHARRFYQGSRNFRGTPEWPGRVATLIQSNNSKTWGLVYRVTRPELVIKTLEHLIEREMVGGEYQHLKVNFHPYKPTYGDPDFPVDVVTSACLCNVKSNMIEAMTYVANISNSQYIGSSSIDCESFQISMAAGIAGTNAEYVERIAHFYIEQVPNGLEEDVYLKEIMEYLEMFKSGNYDQSKYLDNIGDGRLNKHLS